MRIIINDDLERGPRVEIEENGDDIFVIVNGVTVARRGQPGPPEAGTWVALEPGWTVTSSEDGNQSEIRIAYNGRPVLH
jgi:hypothetical protein